MVANPAFQILRSSEIEAVCWTKRNQSIFASLSAKQTQAKSWCRWICGKKTINYANSWSLRGQIVQILNRTLSKGRANLVVKGALHCFFCKKKCFDASWPPGYSKKMRHCGRGWRMQRKARNGSCKFAKRRSRSSGRLCASYLATRSTITKNNILLLPPLLSSSSFLLLDHRSHKRRFIVWNQSTRKEEGMNWFFSARVHRKS